MNANVFIGVAWPYVNGDIHIGHLAGYLFPADIYARYRRFKGDNVLMVSGSDSYGTPTTVEADKRGITYPQLVQEYHPKRLALFDKLNLSYNLYTTTTTENHQKVVQDFFKVALSKGVIFIDSSRQFFDQTTQKFLPDRYVEGTCPNCKYSHAGADQCENCGRVLAPDELIDPRSKISGKSVNLKETQHYYYDWSRGGEFLKDYVHKTSASWRKWSVAETNKWLKEGLKPRAITRDIEWGVDIPLDIPDEYKIEGMEHKKIYVWFEAVIGYLSASIEYTDKYKDWWENPQAQHYYYMGKDNLVFHSLFWPYQLHTHDEKLNLPNTLVVNNFLNLDGKKFSKSKNVIIDSGEIVEQYGLEAVKFYLTSIMPENSDSNFVQEDFEEKVNSVLVNNLGNFVYRTSKLLEKVHSLDYTKTNELSTNIKDIQNLLKKCDLYLSENEFKRYLESVFELSSLGNKRLQEIQPWLIKDPVEYSQIIATFIPFLLALEIAIKPIFMDSSTAIGRTLSIQTHYWPADFGVYWDSVQEGITLNLEDLRPLFKKIEKEKIA